MIKTLLQFLLIGTVAMASNPEPSNTFTFGNGSSGNKVLKFNRNAGGLNPVIQWTEGANTLQFSNDGTNFSDIGSGSGSGGSGFNVLTNPGFESGISQGWSNVGGAFLSVNSGSNLLFGKGSATFQTFGAGQNVISTQYTIPNGIAGTNCSASMVYKGGDANLTFEVVDGSNVVLNSQVLGPAAVATSFAMTFPCPGSGTFALKLVSTAASALIAIDQMFLGSNSLIKTSDTQFIGEASIQGASCTWANPGTTLASAPPVIACDSTPTVLSNPGPGTIALTNPHLPQVTFLGLPPGDYLVAAHVTADANAGNAGLGISDGVQISGLSGFDGSHNQNQTLVGQFHYTNAGDRTFAVWLDNVGGSTTIRADSVTPEWNVVIQVWQIRSTTQTAFRPDQVANSWTGSFVGNTCSWINSTPGSTLIQPAFASGCTLLELTNTNFGTVVTLDTGTPGQNLPGVIFTPSRPGDYAVCLNPTLQSSTNVQYTIGLFGNAKEIVRVNSGDGANFIIRIPVCGIYKATSTAPVTFQLKYYINNGIGEISNNGEASPASALDVLINQIDYALPAPLVINTVVSDNTGIEKIVRFQYGTLAQECNIDPCAIPRQSGGVSVVNHTSGGNYTVHFAGGTFSGPPSCVCNLQSPGLVMHPPYTATEPTSTTFTFASYQSSNALADSSGNCVCVGPK